MVNEYEANANKFLTDHAIEFRAVLIGDDCPTFCEDSLADRDMDKVNVFPRKTHIHGKHYRCTFASKGRGHFTVDFWNSYMDEEENFFAFGNGSSLNNYVTGRENCYWDKYRVNGKYPGRPRITKRNTPNAYDVLASIQKSDVGTFEDFCSDFGYDTDSRRAEQVYNAVVKEYRNVKNFFSAEELQIIAEIN